MKTDWDYSLLADAYLKRPDYSDTAIDAMLAIANLQSGKVCDIGAGVAHLTLMLAARGFDVSAVEPNDAMRRNGIERTRHIPNVHWFEGTGEHTGLPDNTFDMATFGSSFNVCDRPKALAEVARIVKPGGWFACMWNHRVLEDPIQAGIESLIRQSVPDYGYGTRREDQRPLLEASEHLGPVVHLDATVEHEQTVDECVEAWRSHATLARQAGGKFEAVVAAIQAYLLSLGKGTILIPYITNVWVAQVR